MAKRCPFMELCTSKCALRVGEDCAIVDIAKSFKQREIQRYAFSKLANMKYGTCNCSEERGYVDTDNIRNGGINNENT